MHRQLHPRPDLPARIRALQACCLLLVLACLGAVFTHSLTRGNALVAAVPQQAKAVNPASVLLGEVPGAP
jgi:hypothetical protein